MSAAQIWVALLGGGGIAAFIAGFWAWISGRGARKAEAAKTIAEASGETVGWLRSELTVMREDLVDVKGRLARLERDYSRLSHQYRLALDFIREWVKWWEPNHPTTTPPEIPTELRDDL